MRERQNVRRSIVKTQRSDKPPRSENHEVVSTLVSAILRAAWDKKKTATWGDVAVGL